MGPLLVASLRPSWVENLDADDRVENLDEDISETEDSATEDAIFVHALFSALHSRFFFALPIPNLALRIRICPHFRRFPTHSASPGLPLRLGGAPALAVGEFFLGATGFSGAGMRTAFENTRGDCG